MYIFEPTVATGTICPLSILGAPQTISQTSLSPISIEVTLSLSAFGCLPLFNSLPATTPAYRPFLDSNLDIFSTSNPKLVRISDISSGE